MKYYVGCILSVILTSVYLGLLILKFFFIMITSQVLWCVFHMYIKQHIDMVLMVIHILWSWILSWLFISHEYSLWQAMGTNIYYLGPLSFAYFLKTFNLADNFFSSDCHIVFIFHMNIPFDKIFLLVLNLLNLTFKKNIIHSKIIQNGAFILHMSIFCDNLDLHVYTGIKVFVLVSLAIFGIGHNQWHLCFTNISCIALKLIKWSCKIVILDILLMTIKIHPVSTMHCPLFCLYLISYNFLPF